MKINTTQFFTKLDENKSTHHPDNQAMRHVALPWKKKIIGKWILSRTRVFVIKDPKFILKSFELSLNWETDFLFISPNPMIAVIATFIIWWLSAFVPGLLSSLSVEACFWGGVESWYTYNNITPI